MDFIMTSSASWRRYSLIASMLLLSESSFLIMSILLAIEIRFYLNWYLAMFSKVISRFIC